MANRVSEDRVREDPMATDWPAVLQDGTLQGLVAARTLLTGAMRRGSAEALERAATDAARQIDDEIAVLRGLLAEGEADQVAIRPRPRA